MAPCCHCEEAVSRRSNLHLLPWEIASPPKADRNDNCYARNDNRTALTASTIFFKEGVTSL